MEIKLAARLDGIGEYYFSKKLREIDEMRAAGKDIISLGVGGPDQPPHPRVIARLHEEASKPGTHTYQPYKGAAVLREAFARWYDRFYGVQLDPVTEILPLIGSKEGLMHICMTYLNPGDRVLIPNPGYPTYRSAVKISGGECVDYYLREENDWMPDFEEMERNGLHGVKLMLLNFPHMPTGTPPKPGFFRQLVDFARKHHILLVHDNPYSFIRNDKPESLLAVEGAKDVAVELNSLSKSHSMAGWRVGMIGGSADRVDEIIRFKSNMDSGMFYPLQAAAAEALDLDDDWYRSLNEIYRKREVKGYEILDLLGCTYAPNQAGLFVWGRLPDTFADGYACSDKLLTECGVFVTPGGIFGSAGDPYIRISLCAAEETLEKAKTRIENML